VRAEPGDLKVSGNTNKAQENILELNPYETGSKKAVVNVHAICVRVRELHWRMKPRPWLKVEYNVARPLSAKAVRAMSAPGELGMRKESVRVRNEANHRPI
jgi:hypothetical protein